MRIAIMVPTYDGKLHWTCHAGISNALLWCRAKGHEAHFIVLPGNGLIDKARNLLVDQARTLDPDEYVFIDADVGFTVEAFERLLSHDVGMVAGMYRHKADVESYPTKLLSAEPVNGLLEATHLPAGFLRIRRDALARMIVKYNDTNQCWYRQPDGSKKKILHLFSTGMAFHGNEDTPSYVGEDVHFCNLYRMIGGKCWIDPEIKLNHTGEKTWRGDFGAYVRSLEADRA